MAAREIALLPGDGIGPEIAAATAPVLAAAFPGWRLREAEIGWSRWCAEGDPVPPATWAALEGADAALLVAVTSKPARAAEAELAPQLRGRGLVYRSPVLQLRSRLDLYANVRPIDLPDGTRCTVVRENTEGLYGHDLDAAAVRGTGVGALIADDPTVRAGGAGELAVALRVTTGFGWRRLLRAAAAQTRRGRVTVADKPNILQASGEILHRAIDEVAAEHPGIDFELANVDLVAMRMVADPGHYDVIAAENVFGDILSDLGAGLMGGLGTAASANIGAAHAVFEPVHGSAPDIAGRGIANPAAFLLAAAMCGEHLGEAGAAAALRAAVAAALADPAAATPDAGGAGDTAGFAAAVLDRLDRG